MVQTLEINIADPVSAHAGQVVFPVRPPLDPHVVAGDLGLRPGRRLVFFARAGDELVVVVGPGFVVVVDGRQIGVVENVEQLVGPVAGLQIQLPVLQLPAALVDVLVFPLAWDSRCRVCSPHC